MKYFICYITGFFAFHYSFSQADTLGFKIEKYEVRKTEKVADFAWKRKIDPMLVVKLNRFKSVSSYVIKGQKIKIPVYPETIPPPKVTKRPKPEKEKNGREKDEKHVKKKPVVEDSPDNKQVKTEEKFDIEKARIRLLMIDATLELNEALMEGVKASLDSLNIKTVINENSRDKVLPFIKHIRDSLENDIVLLRSEKVTLEARLNPPMITYDTTVTGSETVIYLIRNYSNGRPEERTVFQVVTEKELKGGVARTEGKHKLLQAQKEPEKNITSKIREQVPLLRDTAKVPSPASRLSKDSSAVIKIKMPDVEDSVVIKPVFKEKKPSETPQLMNKTKPAVSGTDSVKRIKAEFFLKRAEKAIRENNANDAKEYLLKSTDLYPVHYEAWFVKAQFEEKSGSLQQALKSYAFCAGIDSSSSLLYYRIGNVYSKLRMKNEALSAYRKAYSLKSDDIPSLMAMATIFDEQRKFDSSVAFYNRVLQIDLTYHFAYKARGQAKMQLKDYASAINDFTRYILFEQNDPSAFFYRGLSKISNNELLDGCLDLSTASVMGYSAAEKAIKRSCE